MLPLMLSPEADSRDYRKDGLLYCHKCHTQKEVVLNFGPTHASRAVSVSVGNWSRTIKRSNRSLMSSSTITIIYEPGGFRRPPCGRAVLSKTMEATRITS